MVTTIAELAKYIDIGHHFVEERVVSNEIRVIYCCTEDMIADIWQKDYENLHLRN